MNVPSSHMQIVTTFCARSGTRCKISRQVRRRRCTAHTYSAYSRQLIMALCSPLRGVKVPLKFHHVFRRSACQQSNSRGLAISPRANASGLESDALSGHRSDFQGEEEVFVARASSSRLDAFLADQISGVSRSRVIESIKSGGVVVNGNVTTKPSHKLDIGDRVICGEIVASPPTEVAPENIPLDVVFEDDHLVVVNKPPGMVVHPSAGHAGGSLVNALLFHCNERSNRGEETSKIIDVPRLGVVHRIDKGTSGLLVMAKDVAAQAGLQTQFANRSVRRRYLAIVLGTPARESGRIDAPIGRDPADRLKMGIVNGATGRQAISNFGVRARLLGGNASLVEWQLETGRTHQIRVHAREMGHPIVGDDAYGGVRSF